MQMQSRPTKIIIKVKRKLDEVDGSTPHDPQNGKIIEQTDDDQSTSLSEIDVTRKEQKGLDDSIVPSETDIRRREQNDSNVTNSNNEEKNTVQEDTKNAASDQNGEDCKEDYKNADNQLVVYDPAANGSTDIEVKPPSFPRYPLSSRILPSVGAFTVQCANCFKWRLIPTKEKYEEIREHIMELPFMCETAREWRSGVTCEDPPDIEQDGSRLWAIDKPNIAQPPSGWQRLLHIRGEGCSKFADVYYVAPSGKKLRSMVEVQKYLLEHPKFKEGVNLSQFSFQIPRPLQDNYVKKRPVRAVALQDGSDLGMAGSLEPAEVKPLSWASPEDSTELRLGMPGLYPPYFEAPLFDPINQSLKRARSTPSKRRSKFDFLYK